MKNITIVFTKLFFIYFSIYNHSFAADHFMDVNAKNGEEISKDDNISLKNFISLVKEKKWQDALKLLKERKNQVERWGGKIFKEQGKLTTTKTDFASVFADLKSAYKDLEHEKETALYKNLITKKTEIEEYAKYSPYIRILQSVLAGIDEQEKIFNEYLSNEIFRLNQIRRQTGLIKDEKQFVADVIDPLLTFLKDKKQIRDKEKIRNQIFKLERRQRKNDFDLARLLGSEELFVGNILNKLSTLSLTRTLLKETTNLEDTELDELLRRAVL